MFIFQMIVLERERLLEKFLIHFIYIIGFLLRLLITLLEASRFKALQF